MSSIYDKLSTDRKRLQTEGLVPDWYTTAGYQLFSTKYDYKTEGRSVRGQFERIAKTAAKHLVGTKFEGEAESKFFSLLWEGLLSPATPVLANMGTDRGLPVSCSGGVVGDSIHGFYSNLHDTAVLTKHGFGTSSYLGDIRHRGSDISVGGKASGVLPVFKDHVTAMRNVAQGTARRGAWAAYIEPEHDDFDELVDHINAEPDDANIGWVITDKFIENLNRGDEDSVRRFKRMMKMKAVLGKGYFTFINKINRHNPEMYKDLGLTVKASNLCSEISLFADIDHTYTCVLSSANMIHWDRLKNDDSIYWMTIFLDCVASEFIERATDIQGLETAVRSTVKGRPLGLGQMGMHTYMQLNMIPFESFEAHSLSTRMQKRLWDESLRASKDLAIELGEPEWCKGYGVRNTHRLACAPTKSCVSAKSRIKLISGETISFDEILRNNNISL